MVLDVYVTNCESLYADHKQAPPHSVHAYFR